MLCVTLKEDGTEQLREEKGNFPRNGFELGIDGIYYKKIGDPRCITDLKFLKEKEEEALKQKKSAFLSTFPPEQDPVSQDGHSCTRIIKAGNRTTKRSILFYSNSETIEKDGDIFTMVRPNIFRNCGIDSLDPRDYYYKIELNLLTKNISIWHYNRELPSVIVIDALRDDDE